ncbi:membrane fusion protein (multidrug efflux system) [Aquamicrobium lusatiense]|uniref:Membrane fusion protein (Multidrug efflux system) n=1 Tax=Aquamicrobium lusatiense TaxID=89772 RepID=A0A7W9S0N6_9HYPH|nr:efflux RND transporter periplasmic adaptor subunit [Aquamicrobium lusatiense]MBB6011916.1 membrane fusion protein (multidrug efflux system) [Aquamicrobium lusatiense]
MNGIMRAGALMFLSLTVASCSNESAGNAGMGPPGGSMGPVEVGVVTLQSQPVPRSAELPGRVVASATAEVRPQVDGLVRRIAFREGHDVKAGDVLYELDDTKFRAAYAAAEASLKKAEAATAGARATFERNEKLAATNAVSAQTLDDARSTLLQAQADEESAKASLQTARINLDNTMIRAPIGGGVGISNVSVGALVNENQTDALVTIRQMDPVYVDLVDSSVNLLRVRDEIAAGRLGRESGSPAPISLTLENGREYERTGTLSLADMVVSQTTGTFMVRASFENPDRVLIPGMFVRAKVDFGSIPDAFLVPQRAVSRNETGDATIYLASAANKAEIRKISTRGALGNDWIVTDGVKNGDRLVVDGFQNISDGTEIEAVEVSVDDDGVVPQSLNQAASDTQEMPR